MATDKEVPIMEICRRLGFRHPLSVQVMSVLKDPAVYLPDVQPMLTALSNSSWVRKKERAVAAWLITHGNWSEDQCRIISETLSETVQRAMQTMRPGRVILRWFADGMLLSFLLVSVIGMINPETYMHKGVMEACVEALALFAFYTLAGSVISVPYAAYRDNRRLRKLAPVVKALGHTGHLTALASLATTILHPDLRVAATSALQNVTAGLLPEDYGTLPTETVPALCRALVGTPFATVQVILQALGVIGDERAIGSVERLLERAKSPEVRLAAANLLPVLQQRAAENEASSLLLRASHSPSDSEQTLLRAAWESSVTDSSQLLRMATSAETEERESEQQTRGK